MSEFGYGVSLYHLNDICLQKYIHKQVLLNLLQNIWSTKNS